MKRISIAAMVAALVFAVAGCQSSQCHSGACCNDNKPACKDTAACCRDGKHCAACPANKGGKCCCAPTAAK